MELQQLVSDVLWTRTVLLFILKAQQHVNLREEQTRHDNAAQHASDFNEGDRYSRREQLKYV